MPIKIYTYANPYKIDSEPYWNEIKNKPYYCVAQTLVNGLECVYPNVFYGGKIRTVKQLTDLLYAEWNSDLLKVKQLNAIERLISSKPDFFSIDSNANFMDGFLSNSLDLLKSIRILFELNIDPSKLDEGQFKDEIKYCIKLFKLICASNYKTLFTIKTDFTSDEINSLIIQGMENTSGEIDFDYTTLDFSDVVIHGVHQFTPIMLRAIDELSKVKNVILLFNYQVEFPNLYQSWINIYSQFKKKIDIRKSKYILDADFESNTGNILGSGIAMLMEGKQYSLLKNQKYVMSTFQVKSDFAQYIADEFKEAVKKDSVNPLSQMNEFFYATDNSVNDLLEIHYPNYYPKDNFLDYGLGQFFYVLGRMWNLKQQILIFNDLDLIEDCLSSGLLHENEEGKLVTIFSKNRSLFEGCTTTKELERRIRGIKKQKRRDKDNESLKKIVYFVTEDSDLEELSNAFKQIESLAADLFIDFEQTQDNFELFYKKVRNYLIQIPKGRLPHPLAERVTMVSDKLKTIENAGITTSLNCLIASLPLVFSLDGLAKLNPQWIVRNFEQIEGDILRSYRNHQMIFHFASLADQNMILDPNKSFPWPLNRAFFEELEMTSTNWKTKVYLQSKREYSELKKFALIQGLMFNKADFKLSYIKTANGRECSPYYLLELAGVKQYDYFLSRVKEKEIKEIQAAYPISSPRKMTKEDYYRFGICKYRFFIDSIIQNRTIFSDPFLLQKFSEILLENEMRKKKQGLPAKESILNEPITIEFNGNIKNFFPFFSIGQQIDVVTAVRNRLINQNKRSLPELNDWDYEKMKLKEIFIYLNLEKKVAGKTVNVFKDKFPAVKQEEIDQQLCPEILYNIKYTKSSNVWCQYCSNKDICLASYLTDHN